MAKKRLVNVLGDHWDETFHMAIQAYPEDNGLSNVYSLLSAVFTGNSAHFLPLV